MQMLLQRNKGANMFGLPTFELWVKFDLTPEEAALIEKYRIREFVLSEGNTWRDLIRASRWAVLLTLVAFLVLFQTIAFGAALILSPIVFLLGTYLIYHQIREQIRVRDVLDGRQFACRSVIKLVAREQFMNKLAIIFCQFLENMKSWGGKEIIAYDPQNLPTVELIERHYALP